MLLCLSLFIPQEIAVKRIKFVGGALTFSVSSLLS